MADQQQRPKNPQQVYREEEARRQQAHAKAVQTAQQAQQLVAPSVEPPAPIPTAPQRATWHEAAEELLQGKGWERCGVNGRGQTLWTDPAGGKGKEEKRFVRMIPGAEGETRLEQLVIPARAWEYCTEEAYGVQRQRDLAASLAVA